MAIFAASLTTAKAMGIWPIKLASTPFDGHFGDGGVGLQMASSISGAQAVAGDVDDVVGTARMVK
ncbi:MAG: hypothetical protein IPJ99_01610 [Betaproteobacteria bacterium]|nr:hypothetical protein [Betaproteobacteria bacterium]